MKTPLDVLVQRARDVGVRADHAREYVAELAQLAVVEPTPRRAWLPWVVGAFGFAAAVAMLLLLLLSRDDRTAPIDHDSLADRAGRATPIGLGDRVAIIAEPNTAYRIARATAGETIVDVERGTITARLWPGETEHRLVLRGAAIEAVATGTIYSLTVDDRGAASVAVHEGKVAVGEPGSRARLAIVEPGHRWPEAAPEHGANSARRLLAATRPLSTSDALADVDSDDASPPPDAAHLSYTSRDASLNRQADVIEKDAAAPPNERWRLARLYRGQGNYDAAVKECLAIADANDKTWSPIALVEAIRIELGPLTSPERALSLADRFAREWRSHDLAPEARELRCRALRQLGRESECAPPPPK